MPFQAVPNTILLCVRATVGGQDVENTFYAQKATSPTQDDVDAVVAMAAAWWASDWQGAMSDDYVMREMYARSLDSEVAVQATDASMNGEFGDLGSATPNNVALAVARRSGFTGRNTRGRIFVAGVPENQVGATMTVFPEYAALITGALDILGAALEEIDLTPVIVSRVGAGATPTVAVVWTILEWVVVNLVVDSMKRRLPRGH